MTGPLTDQTDAPLLAAAARGDDRAFAEIDRRHRRAVAAVAARVLRDATLAEEVTQEIFLDLWRRPHRFDTDRGVLAAFLIVQARTRSVDRIRSEASRRAREKSDALDPGRRRSVDGPGDHQGELVRNALAALDPSHRTPIELAYFSGLSYREVAVELQIAEGTAKSRIRSGLRQLRASLLDSATVSPVAA